MKHLLDFLQWENLNTVVKGYHYNLPLPTLIILSTKCTFTRTFFFGRDGGGSPIVLHQNDKNQHS